MPGVEGVSMGNCVNCTWFYEEDGMCHNPDNYLPGEDYEVISNPYDDYCSLWDPE